MVCFINIFHTSIEPLRISPEGSIAIPEKIEPFFQAASSIIFIITRCPTLLSIFGVAMCHNMDLHNNAKWRESSIIYIYIIHQRLFTDIINISLDIDSHYIIDCIIQILNLLNIYIYISYTYRFPLYPHIPIKSPYWRYVWPNPPSRARRCHHSN